MSGPLSFVILASGTGTNARALIEHARKNPSRLEVKALISDRPEIPALGMATSLGVPTHIVNHRDEGPLLALLNKYAPRWALLAGYKRIVGPGFLGFFQDAGFSRVMNVHPSLLPAYPGLGGYERAFRDGVLASGVTVHLVDSGLDTGAPILQESFARQDGDTLEDFVKRGQKIEHKIYCQALDMAAAGKITIAKGKA
jgi:phosphoribosylglycinamide formyltransferase-1